MSALVVRRCGNEEHPPREAVARVSWPGGRFKPETACRSCLNWLVRRALSGEDGEPVAILVEPIGGAP